MYDLIIVGSGPAGLSAAVYAKRAGLNMLIIEKNPVSGGQIIDTYEVDNYLGIPGVNGFDLATQFREHADKLGAEFVDGTVTGIECIDKGSDTKAPVFKVKTEEGEYEAHTVMLATGAHHSKLGVPGEEEYIGKGVSYCATCDGAFYRGKVTAVNGGGDVAVEDAISKAEILAGAAGMKIAGINSIQEGGVYSYDRGVGYITKNMEASMDAAAGTVVQSAKLAVTANITVIFAVG